MQCSPPPFITFCMGKWLRTEPQTVRGVCVTCLVKPQRSKGRGIYGLECHKCHCVRYDKAYSTKQRNSRRLRAKVGLVCEMCGFKAAHVCQIDVDHIDGNRDNNDPLNHQFICANCHRLKTMQNQDWLSRYAA